MKRASIAVGLLLPLAFLTASVEAQSRTGAAHGRVVDSEGNAVPQATVVVEYQGERTARYELETNKKGRFMKVGLDPGLYLFTASKDGYRSSSVELRVGLGDRTRIPEIELTSLAKLAKQRGEAQNEKFRQAVELTRAKQFDEAEALFKEVLAAAPGVPEIHLNLAYVYVQQEDWAKAEASYLETLELSPGSRPALTGLSGVYMETGRDAEAQELVSRAAQENPEDVAAQFNYGIFLMNSGKTTEAISAFEAVLAADESVAEAHFHLGTLLVGEGKVPEAIGHLETYLSMDPTEPQNVDSANKLIAALKK